MVNIPSQLYMYQEYISKARIHRLERHIRGGGQAPHCGGFEAIKRQTSGVNLRFLINLDALVQNNISTEGTNH